MCKVCDVKHLENVELASGGYSVLLASRDYRGFLYLVACGEGTTDPYFPKFCPECGKKITARR